MTTLHKIGQLLAEIKQAYKMRDRLRAILLCEMIKEMIEDEHKAQGGVLFSDPQNPINCSVNADRSKTNDK